MNNWIWIIILIILIVVIVAWLMRQRHENTIDRLDEEKNDLFTSDIEERFLEAEGLPKTGLYQEKYEELKDRYTNLQTEDFTEIENAIFAADKATGKFDLISASRYEKEAEDGIENAQMRLEQLSADLNKFLNAKKSNENYGQQFKINFEEASQSLTDQKELYRGASEGLKHQLDKIQLKYKEFEDLNEAGDYYQAEEVLDEGTKDLADFNRTIKEIPNLFDRLDNKTSGKIDQIEEAYQIFKENRMEFENDDISQKVNAYRDRIDQIEIDVENLNLGRARDKISDLDQNINRTRDEMMVEYQAYEEVKRQLNRIERMMENLKLRNEEMKSEADRLSQSYRISDELLSFPAKNQSKIKDLENAFVAYDVAFTNHDTVYSLAMDSVSDFLNQTQDLKTEQEEYLDLLGSFRQEEAKFRENADEYVKMMRKINRAMRDLDLPGIPRDYLELYDYGVDKIQIFASELNSLRLDIPKLTELDKECENLVLELAERSQQIREDSRMVRRLVAYLGQNYPEEPTVVEAMVLSNRYYNEDYNYRRSYLTLARALENLEPGKVDDLRN